MKFGSAVAVVTALAALVFACFGVSPKKYRKVQEKLQTDKGAALAKNMTMHEYMTLKYPHWNMTSDQLLQEQAQPPLPAANATQVQTAPIKGMTEAAGTQDSAVISSSELNEADNGAQGASLEAGKEEEKETRQPPGHEVVAHSATGARAASGIEKAELSRADSTPKTDASTKRQRFSWKKPLAAAAILGAVTLANSAVTLSNPAVTLPVISFKRFDLGNGNAPNHNIPDLWEDIFTGPNRREGWLSFEADIRAAGTKLGKVLEAWPEAAIGIRLLGDDFNLEVGQLGQRLLEAKEDWDKAIGAVDNMAEPEAENNRGEFLWRQENAARVANIAKKAVRDAEKWFKLAVNNARRAVNMQTQESDKAQQEFEQVTSEVDEYEKGMATHHRGGFDVQPQLDKLQEGREVVKDYEQKLQTAKAQLKETRKVAEQVTTACHNICEFLNICELFTSNDKS